MPTTRDYATKVVYELSQHGEYTRNTGYFHTHWMAQQFADKLNEVENNAHMPSGNLYKVGTFDEKTGSVKELA